MRQEVLPFYYTCEDLFHLGNSYICCLKIIFNFYNLQINVEILRLTLWWYLMSFISWIICKIPVYVASDFVYDFYGELKTSHNLMAAVLLSGKKLQKIRHKKKLL